MYLVNCEIKFFDQVNPPKHNGLFEKIKRI